MADPISGELVIVPVEAIAGEYDWADAVAFAAAYDDGTNSDYRLITRSEAKAILGNSELVSQLGWAVDGGYWTIEEYDTLNAYKIDPLYITDEYDLKTEYYYAQPVRKVNFYGLPLIDSEFGGGLVFDVVAETRMVSIAAKWADIESQFVGSVHVGWDDAMDLLPDMIGSEEFETLPTRAQALKIFGNSYLVTLLGLPVDDSYWTSEEVDESAAWFYYYALGILEVELKSSLYYALPVRSEVVPET